MIRCKICEQSYCPEHHLKHNCRKPVSKSVPYFTGLRTDPFPFTANSPFFKLPICCAPDCELEATNLCSNINIYDSSNSNADCCNMYFCYEHCEHKHHMCDYPGCDKYAEKCFYRSFGCDDIRCDVHYQMSE